MKVTRWSDSGKSGHLLISVPASRVAEFVQYLDHMRGGQLPEEAMISWRPFAETSVESKKTLWVFRPPSVVLRLVDAAILDGFRAWRESEGNSTTTATIRTYAVRTLLAVAHRDGVLTADQARTMNIKMYQSRTAQTKQPVGRRLTRNEVRQLRSVVDTTTVKGKRDLAILDTMLFLGLRREEVADLCLTAFRQDGGRWWVVFPGKRDKVRRLKVHDVLFQSLAAWLDVAERTFGQSGPVFRSFDRGDHVTSNGIDASVIGRLVSSYGFSAGLAPERGENQLSPTTSGAPVRATPMTTAPRCFLCKRCWDMKIQRPQHITLGLLNPMRIQR